MLHNPLPLRPLKATRLAPLVGAGRRGKSVYLQPQPWFEVDFLFIVFLFGFCDHF